MLDKYGLLAYAILVGPAIFISAFLYIILTYYFTRLSLKGIIISSAMISIIAEYLIFGHYLVQKSSNNAKAYRKKMLRTFMNIEEKYKKNGGNSGWLYSAIQLQEVEK